ncbi:predicted protein [Plenodomus lingam JN3]|uniref:Predicted protein n=1 Tax=Leptosphaeria maculans (strain JN3 / isolate v23.1.3 / race Av1-4-5-6-7-8) TaxID=985895 RepID=E5R474_LEPMJ|nr:predicted protein [Plenodomus lingam JN3]CBX91842.1 predicted protein [Plenodomus lingam JN3]
MCVVLSALSGPNGARHRLPVCLVDSGGPWTKVEQSVFRTPKLEFRGKTLWAMRLDDYQKRVGEILVLSYLPGRIS